MEIDEVTAGMLGILKGVADDAIRQIDLQHRYRLAAQIAGSILGGWASDGRIPTPADAATAADLALAAMQVILPLSKVVFAPEPVAPMPAGLCPLCAAEHLTVCKPDCAVNMAQTHFPIA